MYSTIGPRLGAHSFGFLQPRHFGKTTTRRSPGLYFKLFAKGGIDL